MTARVTIRVLVLVSIAISLGGVTPPGRQTVVAQGGAPERQTEGSPGASTLPDKPVPAPIPTASAEILGPGPMFDSLMEFHDGDDLPQFAYEAREFFISGTADGRPYRTRIVVRTPVEVRRVSGLVLAESMHPSGNAWMFHFTSRYSMTTGHIGVDILTSTPVPLAEFNQARYADLRVAPGQASDILAQVGALIKSPAPDNPLAGVPIRRVILAGSSASAAVLVDYLPAHMAYTLPDGSPIYDGFLPTSTGATIRPVNVPMIQVPTMTEVARGNATIRQDGDQPGDQFRVYEFAGMAHVDSRDAAGYYPDPCRSPISRFPLAAYMSVALDHLWKWIDRGIAPPHADRILVDRDVTNDGSLMALDEWGNVRGGIRNPYVDVAIKKYGVPNAGAAPPIPDAHPFVGSRDAAARDRLCALAGYEIDLTRDARRALHGSREEYRAKVARRLDELTRDGWSLPVYRDIILADAAGVDF
jgi:hypothetical protein